MARKKKKTLKQKRAMNPDGSGNSKYARKKAWLNSHPRPDGTYPFGFQVAHPKPWK